MFQAIIFDLGGVIEKIDPPAVSEAFKKLGMDDAESFFGLFRQSTICSSLERGEILAEEFIRHLKTKCHRDVSSSQIETAWCTNQLGVSLQTFSTLEQLKKTGMRLFVLSNTNPIHAKKLESAFYAQYQKAIRSMFDTVYYSFEIHLRKPEKAAYQYLLKHAALVPEQCIYIDDLEINLEAPAALGMYSVLHSTNSEISTLPVIQGILNLDF